MLKMLQHFFNLPADEVWNLLQILLVYFVNNKAKQEEVTGMRVKDFIIR
jgi:hypothetical protein